jgi:hypothetical protein
LLKGQCQEIFCFRFFSWITFPQAPENNIKVISKIRGDIATGINDTGCTHLKVILKAKIYIYVNSSTQGVKQIIKNFLIEDFLHFSPVSRHLCGGVQYIELRISPQIFEHFFNGPNGKLRGLGENDS